MKSESKTARARPTEVIGWREHIALPELGIRLLDAKIDTGARTSALHALDQRIVERTDGPWVEFMIPVHNRRTSDIARAPLVDERDIKNTSGVSERRLIVRTLLILGRHRWHIEVSLANRERMEFDLILGRSAIRRRGILVNPGRSFVLGQPVVTAVAPPEASAFSALIRQIEGRNK